MPKPRYPIFIPTKGRANRPSTIRMFQRDDVDFRVVVEPSQVDAYTPVVGRDRILVMPEDNRGLVYARNWIKDYATAQGHARHWQFDDDIFRIHRVYRGRRLPIDSGIALAIAEDFVDRYENVGVASLNSTFFIPVVDGHIMDQAVNRPPFYLNLRCYTVFLIDNGLSLRFRHRYNEDADYSLQVLAAGYCTILFNAFLIHTPQTMTAQGGQTDIYVHDGRLRMARSLERVWPGVVEVRRRFHRPQHAIKGKWRRFDTPLKRRPGIEVAHGTNEYGMVLQQVRAPKRITAGTQTLLAMTSNASESS